MLWVPAASALVFTVTVTVLVSWLAGIGPAEPNGAEAISVVPSKKVMDPGPTVAESRAVIFAERLIVRFWVAGFGEAVRLMAVGARATFN